MTYKLTVTTLALTAITSTVAATHTKPDKVVTVNLYVMGDLYFS